VIRGYEPRKRDDDYSDHFAYGHHYSYDVVCERDPGLEEIGRG
jgi:hypothetical protein